MAATAPYGSWASPISAELVAAGGVSLDEVRVAGDHVHWIEGRPLEGGRQVVCRARPGAEPEDLIPEGCNARTRVHEYGGGAYTLVGDSVVFSNFTDQRLYRLDPGAGEPRPITPEPPAPAAHRYADACPAADWSACANATRAARSTTSWWSCRPTAPGWVASRWCWPPAATSTPARGSAPTAAAWPGWSGTTRTCPGTGLSSSWPTWPATGWPAPR